MSSLHTKYSERKNIEHQIKDLEVKLKKLRVDYKQNTTDIKNIMEIVKVDQYMEIKIDSLKPKEKKKPLTKKKKTIALIEHFTKMGVDNPEKFVAELHEVEKNARNLF